VRPCTPNLAPLGIQVTVIEPGAFRTDFLDASSLVRTRQVIPDYSETSGSAREWSDKTNHGQRGDPVKGAAAMVAIATVGEPPLRLQLGTDSIARVEGKLALSRSRLAAWRTLAESTDYEQNSEVPAA